MSKIKKSYRLESDVVEYVAILSEQLGKNATEVVEAAIKAYGSSSDEKPHSEPYAETLQVLREQLAVKDRQIEQLGNALESAQRTAQAAQALQANSEGIAPQLQEPLQEPGEKLTRWERLKRAWRG